MSGPCIAYINAPRDTGELFRRAEMLAGFYDRAASGTVCDPDTDSFTLTGLLERANKTRVKGCLYMNSGDGGVLAEAKARLCRHLGAIHLDGWERERRPDRATVRGILQECRVWQPS